MGGGIRWNPVGEVSSLPGMPLKKVGLFRAWRKLQFLQTFHLFFFLLHRMNVSSFSILTVWQKKLLISIFHTNIHVCVYIYIFTRYKFHISKWSFRRWICLFQVCKATRNPSPLPWGSPSWPRGNGPGAVSGTQQFPVVFLLTSHGKTFRLFFFPGKKKDQHFLFFFLGFVTFGLGGGEGGGLGCWLNFRIVV